MSQQHFGGVTGNGDTMLLRLTEWEAVNDLASAPMDLSSLLAITLAASPTVFAYESPLDSESIREAYFLADEMIKRQSHFLMTTQSACRFRTGALTFHS